MRPFPDFQSGRWQVSDGFGAVPVWARSGREILYADGGAEYSAQIETEPTFRVTGHELLFNHPAGVLPQTVRGWLELSPDDRRILTGRAAQFTISSDGGAVELILVQNFFEELKARVSR